MADSVKFYELYRNFLNDIMDSFPEFKDDIKARHKLFLRPNYPKSEKLVKKCENWKKNVFKYVLDNGDLISKKDTKFFRKEETRTKLAKDIDFDFIVKSDLSQNSKDQLWNYIQTFYMMSVSDHTNNDLSKLFSNFQNILENSGDTCDEKIVENIQKITGNMMETMKNEESTKGMPSSSEKVQNEFEGIFEGSTIGQLAKDIASEINVDDLVKDNMKNPEDLLKGLMGGLGGLGGMGMGGTDGEPNIFSIVQNIGEKINDRISSGELNEMQLLNEAQSIMGNLQNNELFSGLTQGMSQNFQSMPGADPRQTEQRKRLQKKLKDRKNE